jgi:hypothetical protein
MVTLVGSGVWSAKTGAGEMTPEIKMMMTKKETRNRLKANLLAFIDNSPLKLICDLGKGDAAFLFYR